MPTETRWTTAVAIVMPRRTVHTRYRVAKVSAMSCDLSPSSATKMTPKESRVLYRTASTKDGPLWSGRIEARDLDPTAELSGLGPPPPRRKDAARPAGVRKTGVRQYVDRHIGASSPSLARSMPAGPGSPP